MQTLFPFEKILNWYKDNGRHTLPWRIQQTPYHVWISEIFLQQTQVSRVINYFNNVIEKYPDITSFSQTDYDTFFPYYEWLGYYSRARNMLKTAEIIQNQYAWIFPRDYKKLIELPWIGPYTAQAILAFWYNENILSWDTNIEKIFARYYYGSRFIKLSKQDKQAIQSQFSNTCISGRDMNAALMDFSNSVDLNEKNNINWENYLLYNSKFYQNKWQQEYKPEKTKSIINKKDAGIIVILHKNHKEYYSSHPDIFAGFDLWKNNEDHRHYIKKYFLSQYSLSISVRPAYKKIASPKGNYFFYHAQIQTWEHDFWIFTKSEKSNWEDDFETNNDKHLYT